jgi:peptidoglycan lytic transglycosylase D
MLKKYLAFLFLFLFFLPLSASSSDDTTTQRFFDDVPSPKSLSLCGEPVPLQDRLVWERLDREFTIGIWDRAQVFMWLKRAGRYFPHIEKELEKAGLPQDIKYLALAESALIGYVRSRAGAKGYWQFMARTARRNGLRKDPTVDERYSFEHSTKAALKYLQHLHDIFGTWTLAMAAYNCGDTRLRREIKEQRVKDFYRLNLPVETERYIFRIAAIKIIMENHEKYGFRIPTDRIYYPRAFDSVTVRIKHKIHITDVALALGTDFKILKELNPQVLGYYFPRGSMVLKVPAGMGQKLPPVLKELTPSGHQVSGSYYVVKPGDNLHRIAKKTGISVSRLRDYNNIKGSLIKVGQKLQLHP